MLVVDELGRLELDEGGGWVACVELLREARGMLAVASLREECVPALRDRLGPAGASLEVVRVSDENRATLPGCLLGEAP